MVEDTSSLGSWVDDEPVDSPQELAVGQTLSLGRSDERWVLHDRPNPAATDPGIALRFTVQGDLVSLQALPSRAAPDRIAEVWVELVYVLAEARWEDRQEGADANNAGWRNRRAIWTALGRAADPYESHTLTNWWGRARKRMTDLVGSSHLELRKRRTSAGVRVYEYRFTPPGGGCILPRGRRLMPGP